MKYWIKCRTNYNGTYYVACGKMPAKRARKMEESLSGHNTMLDFKTKREYEDKIKELKDRGEHVSEY